MQEYFESYIKPYKYIYTCEHNLKIEFIFESHEFCHLLFGTIPKEFPTRKKYKGVEGYNNISTENVTMSNFPNTLWKYAKTRIKCFHFFDLVLENPKVIYFNPQIVDRGNHKIATTRLNAEFLIFKEIVNQKILFFLLKDTLKPCAFFPDKTGKYTDNQIKLNIIKKEKILK
jgi:hypothetical protein